jgi:hypothetical protein
VNSSSLTQPLRLVFGQLLLNGNLAVLAHAGAFQCSSALRRRCKRGLNPGKPLFWCPYAYFQDGDHEMEYSVHTGARPSETGACLAREYPMNETEKSNGCLSVMIHSISPGQPERPPLSEYVVFETSAVTPQGRGRNCSAPQARYRPGVR